MHAMNTFILCLKQKQTDGSYKQYYTQVTHLNIVKAEKEIYSVLEESLNNEVINFSFNDS